MIKVGIIGATGYSGVELLRLLAKHPDVDLSVITSRAQVGEAVAEFFPNLRGHVDLTFSEPKRDLLAGCDVVFFATPSGTAMNMVPELLDDGVRIIDLSADFRVRDPAQWEKWYGMRHACPKLLDEAIYGLSEINRQAIKSARLVANPGCYATAVLLGFLPLIEEDVVDRERLIADAKSGVSGAGRKAALDLLYCEAGDSLKAYAVAGHRHLPEICQGLAMACGAPVGLTFVPHLIPMLRGIHATLYGKLIRYDIELQECYEIRYRDEPFVDVLPNGAHPDTRSVRGSNVCRIAVYRPQDGETVVVLSVIDNLVKGAAGQAVQNMNIMLDLDEMTGLREIALSP
ncbi:MAG: N-acetyl-gamma-glutamyl-phosphate reductase [Gammaproteobacteria bacterium]|nr:N-acetyl-gamma-glutamyl-phosphate reductase [Gammaproteobacteria bacterium]MCI0590145.1 N-acetyl-gamma-glutamyl-phosphate reductase [Gammaproteobacteria bacterium]